MIEFEWHSFGCNMEIYFYVHVMFAVGRKGSPKCPCLIFWNLNYIRLHDKGYFQMVLRLLISWPWDVEIILDYKNEPSVIPRVFMNGSGREKREDQRNTSLRRTWPAVSGFEDEWRRPQGKECRHSLKAKKDKETYYFQSLQNVTQPCLPILVSDQSDQFQTFYSPKL